MVVFDEIHGETPTYEGLSQAYAEIEAALLTADTPEQGRAVVGRWDELRRQVDTWSCLVELRFEQDTAHGQYRAAREYRDELQPRVTELDTKIKRLLLQTDRRQSLEPLLGAQALALWEGDVLTFDPTIRDDLVRESKLEAENTQLCGQAEIMFRGDKFNLSSITKFLQEADRQVRHDADAVRWDWCAAHADELDQVFHELVQLRHAMARKLGFADFIGLGYKRMNRIDYTERDVENFRREVRQHVVPLSERLFLQQAQRLGVAKLMAWDEPVFDDRGNPKPLGDHDWMIVQATEMFDQMGPLGEFFRMMVEGGYLDLKVREGKAPGGFCTWFASYGMPFIFANFNGTKGDVEVFTHEMGHAFQGYSSREQPLLDYHWPTYESCEIHSMSLEFLTWPHMEKFFGEDAQRFRMIHLTQGLQFLPYGVAVDHFQHLVYAEPDATPQRRHQMWREMEQMYLPWRDWGDLAYPAKGGRWQLQRHIYSAPFYYIDYTLAQTCALQFWGRSQENAEQALEDYVALCRRGGEAPFAQLARSSGLESPFETGSLADAVDRARRVLE